MLKKYFREEEYEKLKNNNELIYKSLEIVTRLFNDKCDKGGFPYVIHLLKVYEGVSDYLEKVCALLHDVVEDTDVGYDDLSDIGYNNDVINISIRNEKEPIINMFKIIWKGEINWN